MKIAIDCDDAAVDLKDVIFEHIQSKGIEIADLKESRPDPAMYPEIGYNLAKKIQDKSFDRGILFCGTGQGMAMVANKVEGVFAGTCHDVYSAERVRKSNDAQVITMGARVVGPELAKTIIDAWLDSEFSGGGSAPKVNQMRDLEKQSFNS
ncbi:MAG: RpiB/LacA/LacB family sugar-phosphate isomerase [Cyclobacteriaceae bacterium]